MVLAAGTGSRLGEGSNTVPKPLRSVAGVPLLVRVLRTLQSVGIREAVIVTGYEADRVRRAILGEGAERRLRRELELSPPDAAVVFDPHAALSLTTARDQVPAIAGKGVAETAPELSGELRADAIRRARKGEGATVETGFSRTVIVDVETRQAAREYLPFHALDEVPEGLPVLFVVAENDELIDNAEHAVAAAG